MIPVKRIHLLYLQAALIIGQASQTLFVIYIRDSIQRYVLRHLRECMKMVRKSL